MSVLEEVLLEEYNRSIRIKKALIAEQNSLPKGSIQIKHIANKDYYYLMYRKNGKVISRYIKSAEFESLSASINKRKENEQALKELNKSIKQIEKALGKDFINEHTE